MKSAYLFAMSRLMVLFLCCFDYACNSTRIFK